MFGHKHKDRKLTLDMATAQLAEQFRQNKAAKMKSDQAFDKKLDELVKDLPMRSRRGGHRRTVEELDERIKRMTSNLGVGKPRSTTSS